MLELNQKVYEISPSVDLSGEKDVRVIVNDEDRGIKLHEVFRKIKEFEAGKIVGHSILEYYTIQDGMLTDNDGNKLYLATDKYSQITFKKVREPWGFIDDEISVNADYVRDIGLLLKLVNTEETITGLSAADKKALKDERDAANESVKKTEEEKELAEAQEIERIKAEEKERIEKEQIEKEKQDEENRIKQEEEKRAKEEEDRIKKEADDKIKAEEAKKKEMEESDFFLNTTEYKSAQKKYARLGFLEYTKDGYHFFYGESEDEEYYPFILAEREFGFYEQLPGGVLDENEKKVEYEFTEGSQDRLLILNIPKGTFIITEQEEEN